MIRETLAMLVALIVGFSDDLCMMLDLSERPSITLTFPMRKFAHHLSGTDVYPVPDDKVLLLFGWSFCVKSAKYVEQVCVGVVCYFHIFSGQVQ